MGPGSPTGRRWFRRYSLRSLIIFVVVVSMICGLIGARLNRARNQRATVETLLRKGGAVEYRYWIGAPKLVNDEMQQSQLEKILGTHFCADVNVFLSNQKEEYTDDDLQYLAQLPRLEEVSIERADVSDTGLAHLARLRNLKKVRLAWLPKVTDNGLAHLCASKSLEDLQLPGTAVSDAGVAKISQWWPGLRRLDLYATKVSDAGLAPLVSLGELRRLRLPPKGTDAGLEFIGTLSKLEEFDAGGCRYSGDGLQLISLRLPQLYQLCFDGVRLVDSDLKHFSRIKNLRTLRLGRVPQVTSDGLVHLESLSNLRELSFVGTERISTQAVAALKNSITSLDNVYQGLTIRSLALSAAEVHDAGILPALAQVSGVTLYGADVGASELEQVAQFSNLRRVNLNGTNVSNESLKILQGMDGLRELFLSRTQFNDAGADTVAQLTELEWLEIKNTKVTKAGLSQLRAALPKCLIAN